jgi:hypothetical protein
VKYYTVVECDHTQIIANKIFNFLKTQTDLLQANYFGWNFIDRTAVLDHVPELFEFFKNNRLVPRDVAVTIIETDTHLPRHIDQLPVVAKMNFPVINTQGWANRWYVNNKLVAELQDMSTPIVFNSQVEHSVEKTTAIKIPRIVASVTFYNEPLHLLQ